MKQVRADHLQQLRLNRSSYIHTGIIMETSVIGYYIGIIRAIFLGICFRHCHKVHVNFVNERNMTPYSAMPVNGGSFFAGPSQAYYLLVAHVTVPWWGWEVLGLIFAGYVPLASKSPTPL